MKTRYTKVPAHILLLMPQKLISKLRKCYNKALYAKATPPIFHYGLFLKNGRIWQIKIQIGRRLSKLKWNNYKRLIPDPEHGWNFRIVTKTLILSSNWFSERLSANRNRSWVYTKSSSTLACHLVSKMPQPFSNVGWTSPSTKIALCI